MSSVKKAYKITLRFFKDKPALFIPFVIFAVVESVALMFIYLAPRMPLRLIFGPLIRTFWGEKFLHYPANFLLLPKLISLSRMTLSVILGSLLSGLAVMIVYGIYNKKEIRLGSGFKSVLKRYISLFIIVFILTFLFYASIKVITISLAKYFMAGHSKLLFLKPAIWMGPILLVINFILAILIQSAFIYAIPILIIEKGKLVKSITKSFVLFKEKFISTIILVGIPMLFYIPIIILDYNTAFLIYKFVPESILLVAFLGIIISALVVDPLVTVSATILYLEGKKER